MSKNSPDYTDAGFDAFLSRSIDNLSQVNLDAQGPVSNSVAYDRTQVSGALGDTLRIGTILIDGVKGRISIYEGSSEVVRLGELDD
jgi:hypothetical protein